MSEVRTVPIEALGTDSRFQVRLGGLREAHVRSLVEALRSGAELPPLVVKPSGESGRFLIVDGQHRAEALRRTGARFVKIVVQDDADLWTSFQLNQLHGLPLSLDEKKRMVRWLKERNPQLSVREIARMVGLSPSCVQDTLSGRRRESAGGGLVQRPDPWRRFFQVLVRAYLRCENEQSFIDDLAAFLADFVEAQKQPGLVWDALAAFADAVRLAWDATSELYSESEDEKAAGS
jgi:hypothetical protein